MMPTTWRACCPCCRVNRRSSAATAAWANRRSSTPSCPGPTCARPTSPRPTTRACTPPPSARCSRWPGGGYLIDTPGIKGFGTFDIGREELTSYFREIFHFSKDCRFNNCTHTHEPGCAVRKAVEDHYIAESRYQSYLSMLDDQEEGKYREAY